MEPLTTSFSLSDSWPNPNIFQVISDLTLLTQVGQNSHYPMAPLFKGIHWSITVQTSVVEDY